MTGIIVKGIGGFYYVKIGDQIIEAKGRGIIKKDGFTLAVGDIVEVDGIEQGSPVITSVFPRRNSFIRPPIANVDKIIIIMAVQDPKPDFNIVDRLIIEAEIKGIPIAICVNKCDLKAENTDTADLIVNMYAELYPVFCVSGLNKEGLNKIVEFIGRDKAALAGASGVGKSTILNGLKNKVIMETGSISKKTNRGRHTTRHVEIFTLDTGGMVFDTPGFTSFDVDGIDERKLIYYYRDLSKYANECRFDNCSHIKEQDCAVRNAVRRGELNKQRYLSYKSNYLELFEKNKY